MSEIEKMYENANIKQDRMCEWTCKGSEFCSTNCEHYESTQLYYPPFTTEKQISLLMFILNKFGDIGFQKMYSIRGSDKSTRKDFIKCLCDCEHETLDSRPVDFYYQKDARGDNLEESIASLINNLWQSLTEEEKQQVRGILE